MRYYVQYRIPIVSNELLVVGPYQSRSEADEHALDIAGYEGVCDVVIREIDGDSEFTA